MSGNIMQRVFDAFAAQPAAMTTSQVTRSVPFPARTVIQAMGYLHRLGLIERKRDACPKCWGIVKGSTRPEDRRGRK